MKVMLVSLRRPFVSVRALPVAGAVALAVLFAACDYGDSDDEPAATSTATAAAAAAAAPEQRATDIMGTAFEPTITVPAGSTVTWTNRDPVQHTVTADDEASFDSDFLMDGQSVSVTFDERGSFPYFCRVHPFMKGTVIVE